MREKDLPQSLHEKFVSGLVRDRSIVTSAHSLFVSSRPSPFRPADQSLHHPASLVFALFLVHPVVNNSLSHSLRPHHATHWDIERCVEIAHCSNAYLTVRGLADSAINQQFNIPLRIIVLCISNYQSELSEILFAKFTLDIKTRLILSNLLSIVKCSCSCNTHVAY